MANTLIRAGCYLRISSDPNDKRNGVQRQRLDTATLCEVQGWTVAEYYEDNDRSASNGKERPAWKRLLADIEAGRIDAIAAWDQDRNWRMMHELEDLRRFFASLGREVKLATTGQGVIDLYSPTGVLTAHIKTAVSEHEIAMMRVRQLRAARQRAEQGRPKWRKAFGYVAYTGRKEDDDGTRLVDESVRPLVVEAYERIVRGETLEGVCAVLNRAGKVGLNGTPWSASTISLFLRSPRNAGLRSHNDEIVVDRDGQKVMGTWDALVDMDLWEAARSVMNAPGRAPGRKSVRRHVLTGVMRCGRVRDEVQCVGLLKANWQRRRETDDYVIVYTCATCRGVGVREKDVKPVIMGALAKRLSRADAVKLLRRKTYDDAEGTRLRNEEAVVRAKLLERTDMLDNDELTREEYARSTASLRERLADLAARQQDQDQKRLLDGIPLGTDKVSAALDAMPVDRLRAIITALMVVTVKPVGKGHKVFTKDRIDIVWR